MDPFSNILHPEWIKMFSNELRRFRISNKIETVTTSNKDKTGLQHVSTAFLDKSFCLLVILLHFVKLILIESIFRRKLSTRLFLFQIHIAWRKFWPRNIFVSLPLNWPFDKRFCGECAWYSYSNSFASPLFWTAMGMSKVSAALAFILDIYIWICVSFASLGPWLFSISL